MKRGKIRHFKFLRTHLALCHFDEGKIFYIYIKLKNYNYERYKRVVLELEIFDFQLNIIAYFDLEKSYFLF